MLHIEQRGHVLVPLSADDPSPAMCVLGCVDGPTGELGDCLERCPNHETAAGACPPSDGAKFACAPREGERTEKVSYTCNEAALHLRPGDVVVACDEGGHKGAKAFASATGALVGAILLLVGIALVGLFVPNPLPSG